MSFAYDALPIVRSLSEIREIDENGIKGKLTAIYCTGKRDKDLFLRLLFIEYQKELAKYKRSFSVSNVAHEIHQGQDITILRIYRSQEVKPCS